MNKLTINGIEYELHFGLAFIRELDKLTELKAGDINFGVGVGQTYVQLSNLHPVALANCIQAATVTSGQVPSDAEIEAYIAELCASKKLKEVFQSFLSTLEESSLTGPMLQRFQDLGSEENRKKGQAKKSKN